MCYYEAKAMSAKYPVTYSVDYPNRPLNRLTSSLRAIIALPILAVLITVSAVGMSHSGSHHDVMSAVSGGGVLVLGPALMILFRQKYPRWWFDWNVELLRFSSRVGAYMTLMDDRYPSTDEAQSVHLDVTYPDAAKDLNRWLPLVKWLLAIPHFVVLVFLGAAAAAAIIIVWFSILFTGNYPRSLFDFVVGVMRWNLRVTAYAFMLVTDEYPPFRLEA